MRIAQVFGSVMFYGAVFGLVAASLGFVIGFSFSILELIVLDRHNAQGPFLFLLTGPFGVLAGLAYGAVKGVGTRASDAPSP